MMKMDTNNFSAMKLGKGAGEALLPMISVGNRGIVTGDGCATGDAGERRVVGPRGAQKENHLKYHLKSGYPNDSRNRGTRRCTIDSG